MFIIKYLSILFIVSVFANCSANPYKTNFISIQEQRMSSYAPEVIPLQKGEDVKLYVTDNMNETKEIMFENGYVLLGSSRFNSKQLDDRRAIFAAKNLDATVVVIQSNYITSKTETVPFTSYRPDRRTRIEDTRYDADGNVRSSRERRITVEGEFQTVYLQQTSEYYDYHATFWAKMKNQKIGVYVSNLSEDLRREYQTNRGVIVRLVVRNTPAFLADVFRDDIFMYFNDERITERKHFFQLVSQHVGEEVTLKGYRDGKPLTIIIQL